MRPPLYAIIGANGKVGQPLACELLAKGARVRVVIRNQTTADAWRQRGAEVVFGDLQKLESMCAALQGADAVFAMTPPSFQAEDPLGLSAIVATNLAEALRHAKISKVVVLSSIGAHLDRRTGGIYTSHILEEKLKTACPSTAFVRPSSFLENFSGCIPTAQRNGTLATFLALSRATTHVSVRDIASVSADLMLTQWSGQRIVELTGPADYTPEQIASAMSSALNKQIAAVHVPAEQIVPIFKQFGCSEQRSALVADMFKAWNSGGICFEGCHETVRGKISAHDALTTIVQKMQPKMYNIC